MNNQFHFLLTEQEKDQFSRHVTSKKSSSLTDTYILSPLFKKLSLLVPIDVSPNLLSLTSTLLLLQGWYMVETHGTNFPIFSSLFATILIVIAFSLDQLDEYHAKNIRNDYSFVELFDHVCSSIGSIFLSLTLTRMFLGFMDDSSWYVAQIAQLIVLNKHIKALRKGFMSYSRTRGPGEGLLMILVLVFIRSVLLGPVKFDLYLRKIIFISSEKESGGPPTHLLIFIGVHFLLHVYFVYQTIQIQDKRTRNLLQLMIFILYIPTMLHEISRWIFHSNLATNEKMMKIEGGEYNAIIISDALIICVITCDVVICRLSHRSIHPVVPLICLLSVASVPLSLAACSLYFITLFFELSMYLRLPVLSVIRNVYVDGIFDMVHIGHLKHFARAAGLGTRLFVGIVNDEDATPYKRKPIMTHEERCELVAASKHVYQVIPNAPCYKGGLNEEFLTKHNIHIVGCGEEYEKPDDEWYGIPRRLGMTRVLPRTTGMSTSDLIDRIIKRTQAGEKTENVMKE